MAWSTNKIMTEPTWKNNIGRQVVVLARSDETTKEKRQNDWGGLRGKPGFYNKRCGDGGF